MNKYKKFLIVSILSLTLVSFFGFYNFAKSSVFENISGYAWNDTNGWTSFNCTSPADCGNSNYGVNKNADGTLTGYAWSETLGWLKFGGLSGFPTGGGTTPENAKVQAGGSVTGWARYCVVAKNPITCDGNANTNYSNGGWDGWVALSGSWTNPVTFNPSGEFSGWAWGGENVVGWVSFNCSNPEDGVSCATSNYSVRYDEVGGPTVSLIATPNPIDENEFSILSWTGVNLDPSIPCVATGGYGSWAGSKTSPSGTFNTGILAKGTYNYSIQCFGPDVGAGPVPSNISTVQLIVGISIDFYGTPSQGYAPNYTTLLTWKPVPSNAILTGCVAATTSVGTNWDNPIGNPPSSRNVIVVDNPTVYDINCLHNGNHVTASVSIPRVLPPETIKLSNTAVVGTTPNKKTNITWETSNVVDNSCVPTSAPVNSSWDNYPKPTPPAKGTQNNVSVPPGGNTTYTLTCVGLYTNRSISAKIVLNENSGATKVAPIIKEQ